MKQKTGLKILEVIVFAIILQVVFSINASAQCASPMRDGSFEQQKSDLLGTPWTGEGTTGIDRNKGLSQSGKNNAWARNTTGWNAIRQSVRLYQGVNYTLIGYIRSSANVKDGYFGFRDSDQKPVSEIKYGASGTYKLLKVNFKPGKTGNYNIFAGFWSPDADSWIQIDNISIQFPCNDTD